MRKYLDIPLTVFLAITLSVAMLWPLEAPPPAPEGSDKLVHFIAFAALAFPLARTGRLGLVAVFIGASAFGGLIELIQPSFNRSADMGDWVADTVGVAIGIGCGRGATTTAAQTPILETNYPQAGTVRARASARQWRRRRL